jgi:hypothetical protein
MLPCDVKLGRVAMRLLEKLGWGVLFTLSSFSMAEASPLVAKQITAENAAEYVQTGPDAAGGIGDWVLSNGSVCAIVSNVDHESELSARGGVLIDLGFCGRADDHYVGAQDLIDSSRETPVNIDRIDAKVGPNAAVVRTFGGQGGVVVETSYRLEASNPNTLFIQKRLMQREEASSVGLYVSVFFNYHSLTPFVVSTREPTRSNGFVQENFVSRGPTEIATYARTADLIVALSPNDAEAPIAYGWQMRSAMRHASTGEVIELPFYALADFSALSFLSLSEPFLFGDGSEIGLTQLLEVPFSDLTAGDEIVFEEAILLAPRADVAGITDQVYAASPIVRGQVSDADSVLHVDLADGTPFTQMRPDADGAFSARLPDGDYALRVVAAGKRQMRQAFSIAGSDVVLEAIDLAAPSRVLLPRGEAMRLVFKGVDGTADPMFGDDLLGAVELHDNGSTEKNGINQIFLMGTPSDPTYAVLPGGQYQVYATRGPEFSLEQAELTVEAANDAVLEINAPVRVVETPGFISADFHVHSGPSFDTVFAPSKRVATYIAEGAEVLVATEHETVFDFQPIIDELGVGDRVVTVTGTEITGEVPSQRAPYTLGHANAFPVEMQPHVFRRGAFANENRRWREVIDDLRARDGVSVIQLNHARADDRFAPGSPAWAEEWSGDRGTYFDHLGVGTPFDAGTPIDEGSNARLIEADDVTGTRDIDFDAMEVLNGYAKEADVALRRDWLSLVAQGYSLTATANSDSHTPREQVAMPRNMVAMTDDTLEGFDQDLMVEAVKAGRTYGTTGPMLNVTLDGKGVGETFAGPQGELTVLVAAAPWVNVSTLDLIVNGELIQSMDISAGEPLGLRMAFEKDSFVVVEVKGEASDDYSAVYPRLRPYAFSNPIYVDADGDGVWTAPGLSD